MPARYTEIQMVPLGLGADYWHPGVTLGGLLKKIHMLNCKLSSVPNTVK